MKPIIALIAAATLSACSTSEMVAMAQNECSQIGYAPGSAQYVECVERGYRGTKASQEATISTLALWAAIEAVY